MVKEKTTAKYFQAVGRRKTAVARVRISEAPKDSFEVNDKELHVYFPTQELQLTAKEAISKLKHETKFLVTSKVHGGGISAQAEAMRLGISRALLLFDIELRGKLKKSGYLKRDPRAKERRKFGLKKARKAAQWSKR